MSQNCRIGYARVSTDHQILDLQLDALKKAGCSLIYEEKASGKSSDRVELKNCLKALRPGDTLVVWRLDRLGRSLSDLIHIVTELEGRGISFESLTEKIDTRSATGKLVFHIFGSLAEFERMLTLERIRAGLEAAKARGRTGGRPRKLDEKAVKEIRALLNDPEIRPADVARRYGVSRSTLFRYLAKNNTAFGG
jgi:DNA invertase Pin-like site-specific DNA recombinase